jgi:glutamine synthetase
MSVRIISAASTPDSNVKPEVGYAEYVWLDANQNLRSKTRVIEVFQDEDGKYVPNLKPWSFDGSSTNQAEGGDSDCLLSPCNYVRDPFRKGSTSFIVLCEVYDGEGNPHPTNFRYFLRNSLESGTSMLEAYWGFEQEYVLHENGRILGWPEEGEPGPQGPYYCGAGALNVAGREIVDEHLEMCVAAGLMIFGANAEVMLGQWEFQIGYRDFSPLTDPEEANALVVSDHLWMARYLLERVAEQYGVSVDWDPKPRTGDWNGSGCHTNFSTITTRNETTGRKAIQDACKALEGAHFEHMSVYGEGNEDRLTGLHETCSHKEFKFGPADRGASIRIPRGTEAAGYGYIEDRRPASNCNPYQVTTAILNTLYSCWGPAAKESLSDSVRN